MSELPINQVVTGDCREVMAEWPGNCIDFVMFSPPYWGLRDYGGEAESVWGGGEDCDHVWGDEIEVSQSGGTDKANVNFRSGNGPASFENHSKFCQKCGAWRGQFGLEPDYRMYVQHLVEVGREIKRILKPSGSWYLNLGDTYCSDSHVRRKGSEAFENKGDEGYEDSLAENREESGRKRRTLSNINISEKCKLLMPYRVALALVDDGWICRNDIIWLKPNPMPSSVKDRLNTTTERIFHFVKEKQYFYDLDAIREPHAEVSKKRAENSKLRSENHPNKNNHQFGYQNEDYVLNEKGKNPGDVIEQTTEPFPEAHFAVYPPNLCEKPIKSSCPSKVCVECGEPYERNIEYEDGFKAKREYKQGLKGRRTGSAQNKNYRGVGYTRIKSNRGWKKTCDCSTNETVSGIVLDPMCGAGSTLVKAKQLGRRYIGIEISEEYAEITRERLRKGDEEYKRRKRKERRFKREAEGTANLEEFV